MRTRPHPVVLDSMIELPFIAEALYALRERAERDGNRVVALLSDDATEALLALLDGIEHQHLADQ